MVLVSPKEENLIYGIRLSSVGPSKVTGSDVVHEPTNMDLAMKLHYLRGVYYFNTQAVQGLTTMKIKEATFPWLDLCYMACGRLRRSDSGRPYIKCNDCGMRFIEARCSKTLDEWLEMMKDDDVGGGSLHKQLVSNQVIGPELPFSPLVLIKLTWFKCGAMSIGLSFAHVLSDIFSLSDFINILGQILSEQHPNPVPNLIKSRSLTKQSENPQPPSQNPVSVKWIDPVGDNWVTTNNCKMDMCSVHISPTQLSQLRSKISGSNETDRFPSFECLCALFWKFIAQIRERPSPNRVTLCRKGNASPKKMMNVLSNTQVISVLEADFSMVMEGELKELTTLLVNESKNEQTLIEQAVESDGGTSDLIVYGANLTFANWEEANLYGCELHGHKPVFVNYSIDSIGDGGVVLVLSSPPKDDDNDDIGQLGRIVTVILPENEMLELKSEMKKEGWCLSTLSCLD